MFPNLLCASLVNFNGIDLGLFNLLFFISHCFVLTSLFLTPNKISCFHSFICPDSVHLCFSSSAKARVSSPPPVLYPFSLVSSTHTIPSAFSFRSLHPHLPSSVLSPSVFHPLLCHLPIPSLSVLSSSFLPWCHLNYWSILCSLSSLSSPLLSPSGTQACLSPFVSGMRLLWVFRHLQVCLFLSSHPSLAVSCLSLHFPLSAYPSQSIIMSFLCLSPSFPTEAIIINHAGRCTSSGQRGQQGSVSNWWESEMEVAQQAKGSAKWKGSNGTSQAAAAEGELAAEPEGSPALAPWQPHLN